MQQRTPAWVADAIFYQIFPDRFAASASVHKPAGLEPWDASPTLYGFKGGDLEGVRERLSHVERLGATAIYFNPIFASTANHRYHTHDFHRVDPLLGGDAAFRRLLDEAHARGLRVILDGVFNHASRGFYQFSHTLENGARSPYLDWFHFNRDWLASGRPLDAYAVAEERHAAPAHEGSLQKFGYRAWWDIPALPKFNTQCAEVRRYLFEVAERWVDFGIDGWRLDVPSEIDDAAFWREFRDRVKSRNPDAYIVGEIWDDASRWLQGDQFDGVTNYLFARLALGHFFEGRLNHGQLDLCGLRGVQPLSSEAFAEGLKHLWRAYPRDHALAQMNLVGSHDTPRLLNIGSGDVDGVKLVYLCLFASPGAPCVYYGDEVGMPGNHDPDNRRGMEWDERLWNGALFEHVKACAAARRRSVALRRGDFGVLHACAGLSVLWRKHEDDEALVAFNVAPHEQTLELPLAGTPLARRRFAEALPRGASLMEISGDLLRLRLPGRTGQLWLSD